MFVHAIGSPEILPVRVPRQMAVTVIVNTVIQGLVLFPGQHNCCKLVISAQYDPLIEYRIVNTSGQNIRYCPSYVPLALACIHDALMIYEPPYII